MAVCNCLCLKSDRNHNNKIELTKQKKCMKIQRISKTQICRFICVALITMMFAPQYSCSQSKTNHLDGKQFTIVTMEKDKPVTAAIEHGVFDAGTFNTIECARWGFEKGAYTSKAKGDEITWESTLKSSTEGIMIFTGKVAGEKLEGTMVWKKDGQQDIHYVFESGETLPEESAKLDGHSFQVKFTDSSGETEETITFNSGMFESPGCYEWGFSAAPYKAWIDKDKIRFESTYTSATEGTMVFSGSIAGGEVSGTQLWKKEGQDDITYAMTGWIK